MKGERSSQTGFQPEFYYLKFIHRIKLFNSLFYKYVDCEPD